MNMKKPAYSPALTLVVHVWNFVRWRSKQHYQTVMAEALHLAIKGDLEFADDDIKHILHACGGHNWFHGTNQYITAVEARNTSACRALEVAAGHGPFIWESYRIAVDSDLIWNGVPCKVTSFAKNDTIIACSYKPSGYPRKIDKRFRITRAELRVAEKARLAVQKEQHVDQI